MARSRLPAARLVEARPGVGLGIRKELLRRRGVIKPTDSRGSARPHAALARDELAEVLDALALRPSADPLS